MDISRTAPTWQAPHQDRHRATHRADGPRESRLGLHTHSRCFAQSRYQGRARYDSTHSEGASDRARTGSRPASFLVDVPKAHWKAIAASDFFTVEVWSWRGLITHYVLFVIDLATRRVFIGGITTNPNEMWMLQVARTLMDCGSGVLLGKRHLIIDRDTKYSSAFRIFSLERGVEVIRLPPRSPNFNAYAERFVRSVKAECLSKLIPIACPDAPPRIA